MFNSNTAYLKGGAVFTDYQSLQVELEIFNTTFADNLVEAGDGGALGTSTNTNAWITSTKFERNKATSGGAITMAGTTVHLIDSNFTNNSATSSDGGAMRCEENAFVYPRGTSHFKGNAAAEDGGAVSLDASSLKTNEGALVFTDNSALRGGAVSEENGASLLMSPGCQTITFEMNWAGAEASDSQFAVPSVLVRRIPNAASHAAAVTPGDLVDARGEWMRFLPSVGGDTNVSRCLAVGEYEIVGSGGPSCVLGWGGGFIRVVDLTGSALLTEDLTMAAAFSQADALCTVTTNLSVPEDNTLTNHPGALLFDNNRAAESGGALYVGEDCSAELHRVDFTRNSAMLDGGALFVGLLGDLTLDRSTMRNNTAERNGGATYVSTVATISVNQAIAEHNRAGRSGGMIHLSGVAAATLRGIDATHNHAGSRGGAVALADSTRNTVTLTESTIRRNKAGDGGGGLYKAGDGGGGLYLDNSEMDVAGVQLIENVADPGHGGGAMTTGEDTLLDFSDTECVEVEVLIDWIAAGDGCTDPFQCIALAGYLGRSCLEVDSLLRGGVIQHTAVVVLATGVCRCREHIMSYCRMYNILPLVVQGNL